MPLFKLNKNRHIDTDQIADITYTPANAFQINVVSAADQSKISSQSLHHPSYLNIELKSTETIRLEGEEADAVWADFQKVMQRQSQAGDTVNVTQSGDSRECQHRLTVPVFDDETGEQIGTECSDCHEQMPWAG